MGLTPPPLVKNVKKNFRIGRDRLRDRVKRLKYNQGIWEDLKKYAWTLDNLNESENEKMSKVLPLTFALPSSYVAAIVVFKK